MRGGRNLSHGRQRPNPRRTPVGLSSVYFLSKGILLWCAHSDVQVPANACRSVTMRPAAATLLKIAAANCFGRACRSGAAALFKSSSHCCKPKEIISRHRFEVLFMFYPRGNCRIIANNSRIKSILTHRPHRFKFKGQFIAPNRQECFISSLVQIGG